MFTLALTFFLVANPIGNLPGIIALIKDFDFQRQRYIVLREGTIALFLALFFQYVGEVFLGTLQIQDYALMISGGILLFIVSLGMLFSNKSIEKNANRQEPCIVPIATPILSGPGLLAMIMLKSKLENNNLKITLAILLAWVGVFAVLAAGPYLQKVLGKRGLTALEQVMGMIIALIGVEMIVKGGILFSKTLELQQAI